MYETWTFFETNENSECYIGDIVASGIDLLFLDS